MVRVFVLCYFFNLILACMCGPSNGRRDGGKPPVNVRTVGVGDDDSKSGIVLPTTLLLSSGALGRLRLARSLHTPRSYVTMCLFYPLGLFLG